MAQDGAAVSTTKLNNLVATPALRAGSDQSGANIHAWYDTITLAASTAQYITMARAPQGARISPNSRLTWTAGLGASLSVGDQFSSQRFMALTATTNFGCQFFNGVDAHGNYRYSCEQDIRVYTGGTSAAMTGTVEIWLEYCAI